ncbi:hypothetical protein D3OALGA1CA_3351 [Olavius algarvensis associated proteobacterium Delta 3]|nr:hypothetical protein D3OALGB2SA_1475 [Olavius algarvensis associated proteobacterium Delta 3]CAB5132981.1 hypothetical protein D3OALGA1CA_3351 [Olavius algarvensis associated proteobacterium Delta 3]
MIDNYFINKKLDSLNKFSIGICQVIKSLMRETGEPVYKDPGS